jgi:TetR/AcrR family transcriptional regulator, regulator of cefoperazone and chloramphenicol sensitivity
VNIATLHYYFPSKQDLIEGLAELLSAMFVTLHGPAPRPSGLPALDRLRQEFSDGRFYLKHHPEMLLVIQEFGLRGKRDPEVRKISDQMIAHWREGVERMVEEGAADGTWRDDIPTREMFTLLMAIFTGVAASGAGQVDAIERNTEDWILSPKAKKKLAKSQGAKQ